MQASDCLTRNQDVIAQRAKDKVVLFNMAKGDYFSLNELGARTWELLDGSRSLEEVVVELASEYDAPMDVIAADVKELTEHLQAANLLVAPSVATHAE
jgi:hypothetical protein